MCVLNPWLALKLNVIMRALECVHVEAGIPVILNGLFLFCHFYFAFSVRGIGMEQ